VNRNVETNGFDVSVLIPVSERPIDLETLYRETSQVLRETGYSCEFVFALEPWAESMSESLARYEEKGEPISLLRFEGGKGTTGLAKQALRHCEGRIVLVMPAYGRVKPSALPALIDAVTAGADLALARRWPRRDPRINRVQTRVLHALLARATSTRLHDVGSGVWAGRREVLEQVPLYGDFLRFLPVLAVHEGFRVEEVECPQHQSDLKARVYGPSVYLRRLLDLFALVFLTRFTHKPLRFFGLVGSVSAIAGTLVLVVVAVQRLAGQPLANRPVLLLGVLLVTLGVQAVALGLIGEIIVHLHESTGRRYRLRSKGEARGPEDGAAGSN
jgi:hypothetical protein